LVPNGIPPFGANGLAFNRAGKPKAVKSTIKYETETE